MELENERAVGEEAIVDIPMRVLGESLEAEELRVPTAARPDIANRDQRLRTNAVLRASNLLCRTRLGRCWGSSTTAGHRRLLHGGDSILDPAPLPYLQEALTIAGHVRGRRNLYGSRWKSDRDPPSGADRRAKLGKYRKKPGSVGA
jgi:hypothetical protein